MYQATGISLRIGKNVILTDIDLTLRLGTFTAIVGPNGAGKSSLLKAIAHEYTEYQGELIVNGKPVRSYKPKELSLVRAVLPQSSTIQFAFLVEHIILQGRYA